MNCNNEGSFESQCPKCGSENILAGKSLQTIPTTVKGYSALMNAYYNTIDLASYLKSSLMPSVTMSETNAEEQVALLNIAALSPIGIDTENISGTSRATANSAVLSMAKIIVRSTYKVEIEKPDETQLINNGNGTKTWKGKFIVTNYSDEEDTATSAQPVSVIINSDEETFIRQKIEKALNKEDTDDYSISGLFEEGINVTMVDGEKQFSGDFCDELKKYALAPLTTFHDACEACIGILIAQKVGEDTTSDLYKKLYVPYSNRLAAIRAEMKIREDEINIITGVYDDKGAVDIVGLQTNIVDCKNQIQAALNFETYLGEELWKEFCLYRREDKYSNNNYISDGLNNAELFKRALEFIEIAENEIFKSAELQHSISTNLNNLLAIPKFKELVKYFKVGNWIRVRVNDEVYKLRLLQYKISYGSFENIPVEFSDVTKIRNGITDVQDILSQASAMASSYDSVQRQAKKGNVAQGTIEQWISDGLNSANVQIQNNDNEEILITKNGLLGRSKSDITGEYSPEQLKLTHNIMAYTTDGWETVSTALGKHDYKYWKNGNFIDGEDYGLTSKFVQAGYITGSQMIGGEIISSNYESGKSGTHFDLINGDFEIAGGKIVYDTKDNAVTLNGVTIEWSSTNAPAITNITGLEDYLKQLDELEKQLDGRIATYSQTNDPSQSWAEDEYDDHIGDLWINSDNGITKTWNGSEWIEITDSNLAKLAQSKAQIFISTPIPPYYVGDLWVQGLTGDIKHCVATKIDGQSYSESDWAKSSKYTDDTRANEAYTLADNAKGVADNAKIIGDNLVNGLGFQETEVTGEYVISPVIAGGTLLIGDTTGTYAQINKDGKLTCTHADVSGAITATSLTLGENVSISSGKVSGLSNVATSGNYNDLNNTPAIPSSVDELGLDTSTIIFKGDISQSTKTDSNGISYVETSVPSSDGTSITYSTYNADDYIVFGRSKGTNSDGNDYIGVSKDGLLTARNAVIYGTVYATDGEFNGKVTATEGEIGGCSIVNGVLQIKNANIAEELVADTVDVDELSAITANMGTVTSGVIQSLNFSKSGNIAIWNDETADKKQFSEGLAFTLSDDGTYYICTGTGICTDTDIIIPSTYEGLPVMCIDSYAFEFCHNLTSIVVPDSVTTIHNGAFYECTGLKTIVIGNGVDSLSEGLLSGCYSLESITLPFVGGSKFATTASRSTLLGYIFGASDYQGGVSTDQYYDTYYIPSSLKSITITGGNIFEHTFRNCSNLEDVTIVSHITNIGTNAFMNCSNMTSIIIPNGVENIGNGAFVGCSKLSSITLPDSLVGIGDIAFRNCSNLMNMIIPNSVTSIGGQAFYNCTNFTRVYYAGAKEEWAKISIASGNDALTNATCYYYSATEPTTEGNYWHYDNGVGFRISCDDEYLIDSRHFKVTPDGNVTATNGTFIGEIHANDGGTISGWDITENGIERKDNHNNPIVGMYSSDVSYLSLVKGKEDSLSPVRFYAGACCEEFEPVRNTKLIFDKSEVYIGQWLTRVIELSEEEQERYKIVGVENLTPTAKWVDLKTSNFYVETTTASGNGTYIGSIEMQLNVVPNEIVSCSCVNDGSVSAKAEHLGEGKIRISTEASTASSFLIEVRYNYDYTEFLNVKLEQKDTSIVVNFKPQASNMQYELDIQYVIDLINQNFKVLEDGSLYANNAKIAGTIYATEGEFTGKVTATEGEFNGTVKAIDGNIGGLIIDNGIKGYVDDNESFSLTSKGLIIDSSSAEIKVGSLHAVYDASLKETYLQTTGALYIRSIEGSSVTSSIELMTDNTEDKINPIVSLCTTAVDPNTITIKLVSTERLYQSETYTIHWQFAKGVLIGTHNYDDSPIHSTNLTIEAYNDESLEYVIKPNKYSETSININYVRFKGSGDWLNDDRIDDNLSNKTIGTIDEFEQYKSNKHILITGSLVPKYTEQDSLGKEGALWTDIWASNSTIQPSDKNKKNNIEKLSHHYESIFDNLNPVSYKLNNNTSNRTHTGLIAQDVKEAIENAGLTTQDFAGYCEWKNDDGTIGCGLRYGEFISLCIDQIQKLKKRVEELEDKIKSSE